LDPILLAGFMTPGKEVLELGAGCGVLSILLLAMGVAQHVTAVEVQSEMAALVERNALANGLGDSLQTIHQDLRQLQLAARFDRIVFNPPYYVAAQGHASPEQGRDIARHERLGKLADFVDCAVRHAQQDARLAAIVPVHRLTDLQAAAARRGAHLSRKRYIVARVDAHPKTVMAEFVLGPAHADVLEPLIVHVGGDREFSAEVKTLLHEL
jgi:tRNA1(Val) A37 N6-methylase TrmN6